MAITSTQDNGDGIARFASGSYIDTGTVAAFDITCGFRPRYVKVINEDGDCMMEWCTGMADGEGMKTATAGDIALVASNGITPLADGFTIGLDTDLVVTSEQLRWIAFG
ncbi:MAG: hypothetical protein KF889_01595 [Alphaproteobacteria bacterium]|nr:hypothetical protein [Alphaproteobacteria bacterium]MCW5741600.1 hypothetical protein [Alphaproteobacteria bacterium]